MCRRRLFFQSVTPTMMMMSIVKSEAVKSVSAVAAAVKSEAVAAAVKKSEAPPPLLMMPSKESVNTKQQQLNTTLDAVMMSAAMYLSALAVTANGSGKKNLIGAKQVLKKMQTTRVFPAAAPARASATVDTVQIAIDAVLGWVDLNFRRSITMSRLLAPQSNIVMLMTAFLLFHMAQYGCEYDDSESLAAKSKKKESLMSFIRKRINIDDWKRQQCNFKELVGIARELARNLCVMSFHFVV